MAVRYITSHRGGRKLVFEDFIYMKKNSSATSTYWACSKRDSLGCMVTAISSAPNPDLPPRVSTVQSPHQFCLHEKIFGMFLCALIISGCRQYMVSRVCSI